MSDPFISSDPNAWLRPYWAELHRQRFFANLAAEHQARALAEAIETDHPAKAAEIREWNTATTRAMIACLDQALEERHTARQEVLWRARKGARELCCVAVYLPVGIDVRVIERDEPWQTRLVREPWSVDKQAELWRTMLADRGWQVA